MLTSSFQDQKITIYFNSNKLLSYTYLTYRNEYCRFSSFLMLSYCIDLAIVTIFSLLISNYVRRSTTELKVFQILLINQYNVSRDHIYWYLIYKIINLLNYFFFDTPTVRPRRPVVFVCWPRTRRPQ